jgi:hypothetical protein
MSDKDRKRLMVRGALHNFVDNTAWSYILG